MAEWLFGVTIRASDVGETIADTTTPTPLGAVMNVTPPNATRDILDVTSHDSPDGAREFLAGLIDYGEASFEMNWTPNNATDQLLNTAATERQVRQYEMTFPLKDNSTVTCLFDAYLTGYERGAPMDDKATGTVTLKVTGAPAWSGS